MSDVKIFNENFKCEINTDTNVVKTTREYDYIKWTGELKKGTRIRRSKNTSTDKFDKRIGIVVSILKTLGYSRRIVGKTSDLLLEENNRWRR
jgi:hypothetical protein